MLVPAALLLVVLALLVAEALAVRRSTASLAWRVHVNGTRGKSSVTRYIAAGLRTGGRRVQAKITGIIPTTIDEQGNHEVIRRRGGARVQEQFETIRRAVRDHADALVLECMSLRPELQGLESRWFQPQVCVLTNVRDDHREVMGDTPEEQARSLCSALHGGASVVTIDGPHLPIVREEAERRRCKLIVVPQLDHTVRDKLPGGVVPDNIALALAACAECGCSGDDVLAATLAEARRDFVPAEAEAESDIRFVNGFAVNDVPSATQLIDRWRRRTNVERLVLVFNARADRPTRSQQFSQYLPRVANLHRIILIGDHAPYMRRALTAHGYPSDQITVWSSHQIEQPADSLAKLGVSREDLVIGLGNIGGPGHALLAAMSGKASHHAV